MYIFKLASGDPESEESADSPPPKKKLSAVLSPLSQNGSLMRSFKSGKDSKKTANSTTPAKDEVIVFS